MSRNSRADQYSAIPIPTYEEAISRPSSSQHLGPTETSHDAQRQGLLGGSSYRAPTVESARNSLDSDLSVPEMMDEQRELEEMDYLEPGQSEAEDRNQARRYHRARLRSKFAQSLSSLVSSIRIPSLRRRYVTVPPASTDEEPAPRRTWREWAAKSFTIPEEYRMSLPVFIRLVALMIIFAAMWFLFTSGFFPRRRAGPMWDTEAVKNFALDQISATSPQGYIEHLTSFTHEAGTEGDYFMARWVFDTWKGLCKFDQEDMIEYSIFATYPVEGDRSLSVLEPADALYTAVLEEPHDAGGRKQTLVWHTHSASGTVQGSLVYANAGSREDFNQLQAAGIPLNGSIALVYSNPVAGPQNLGLKVRFAQDAGCGGVLVYNGDGLTSTDQQQKDLGGNQLINLAVQRGNVALSNWILGDPMTPGKASEKGQPKDKDAAAKALPSIPSLPISRQTANELILRIGDKGHRLDHWLPDKARTGDGSVKIKLQNQNDNPDSQRIWQVQGILQGTEVPEQKLIIGAPRDAYCFDASGSASATTMMTGIITAIGALQGRKWAPLRTIEFASWDGNIFNNAGSAEYVEGHLEDVRSQTIAYLNVAAGVRGHDLQLSGSPLLKRSLQRAMDKVAMPDGTQTVKAAFEQRLNDWQRTEAMTDSSAFTYIAGVPSVDMSFGGPENGWMHGSCSDTVNQMQVSDKDWAWHKVLAQVWALVILDLAAEPLIPMNVNDYADTLSAELLTFEEDAKRFVGAAGGPELNYTPLQDAVDFLKTAAEKFHAFEVEWTNEVLTQGGIENLFQSRMRLLWNDKLVKFEKAFIDLRNHKNDGSPGGLKDRPQFRHILTAPHKWEDKLLPMPSVWDFIYDKNWSEADKEIARVAAMISEAAKPFSSS